ncbi:hypothetical protein [Hyphococcus lacteus]|uniref:Uncharacterized protein n=1 Tax=Hyphococcus lacteus TaxID=3143536 RepID=A0ABV3Z4A4_9PROT
MKINDSNYTDDSSLDRLRRFVSKTLGKAPQAPSKASDNPTDKAEEKSPTSEADKTV